MALATNALLALCDSSDFTEVVSYEQTIGEDGAPKQTIAHDPGPLPRPPVLGAPTVCSGQRARKGEPHYHLLRSLTGLANTSTFEVQRL